MKSFDELYDIIEPQLAELDVLRAKYYHHNKKVMIITVILTVISLAFAVMGFVKMDTLFLKLFAGMVLVTLVHFLFRYNRTYETRLKHEILPIFVKLFDKALKYTAQAANNTLKTEKWLFAYTDDDIITTENRDIISGNYKKTGIEIAEVDILRYNSDSRPRTATVFKGLYWILDFNKSFATETLVTNRLGEVLQGSGKLNMLVLPKNRVKLENPIFEDRYDVYSTDQVEARFILSLTLMERIMEIEQFFSGYSRVLFKDGKVHIVLATSKDFFRVDYRKPLTDKVTLKYFYNEFFMILSLVDLLKLNQKLWSKQ